MKLNTDGCWYNSDMKAGFGGLFPAANGKWIESYCSFIKCNSSLETEQWAIYKGLAIMKQTTMPKATLLLKGCPPSSTSGCKNNPKQKHYLISIIVEGMPLSIKGNL